MNVTILFLSSIVIITLIIYKLIDNKYKRLASVMVKEIYRQKEFKLIYKMDLEALEKRIKYGLKE